MARPRSIEEQPLPNWPVLLTTEMASRYLSLDENSFNLVVHRGGVRPVDLGLAMTRWRRTELDRLINALPSTSTIHSGGTAGRNDLSGTIVREVVEELGKRMPSSASPVVTPREMPDAMSITAATQAIGIGRSTIYKLIGEGRLKPVRIGTRTLLRREDVQALLRP